MLENGKGRRLLALLVGGCVCGAAVLILRVVPEGAQVQSGGRGSLSPQPVGFQSGAVGTQGGQAVNVPAARVVNLGALPQATAAQLAPAELPGISRSELAAWVNLGSVLLNLDEFITKE